MAKGEQETIRILDKRKLWVAYIVIAIAMLLIGAGVFANILNVLLPFAGSLMTGVIGYYFGGQANQTRKLSDVSENKNE